LSRWGIVALVAACAPQDDDAAIERTYDPCQPPHLIAPAASASQRAGIASALRLWRTHTAEVAIPEDERVLEVELQRASGAFLGLYDDRAGIIYLNDDLGDGSALAIVAAHELGHAFGLHHVGPDVRASVMNPGNLDVAPTEDDLRMLATLWGACEPDPLPLR
jgi:Matrixin